LSDALSPDLQADRSRTQTARRFTQ
jgi:hypothetical protein